MLRTWCAFAGLCAGGLMRDNSFRLAPLDTSLMEGGKGKRNAEALSGATSLLRSSCRRKRRGEPISESTKDTPCGVCALSGATSLLRSSCRRKRRGEPTSENSGSFSPALSFGCGSSPESATKEKEECKCIDSGTTSPLRGSCHCCAMGRTEASYPAKVARKRGMQKHSSFFLVHFQGLEPWAH